MIGRLAIAISMMAVVGCVTVDGDVLAVGATIRTCAEVEMRASDNQACGFAEVCALAEPGNGPCCQTFVTCVDGFLQFDRYCPPTCMACRIDSECTFGQAVCDGQQCVACRPPSACPPCPSGLAPLTRNGCATCECAPASECQAGAPGCDGAPTSICYPGMVCASGCDSSDPGCCANVCSEPGCPSPAPLGCATNCADPTCTDGACVTVACECIGTQWVCRGACGPITNQCFQPSM